MIPKDDDRIGDPASPEPAVERAAGLINEAPRPPVLERSLAPLLKRHLLPSQYHLLGRVYFEILALTTTTPSFLVRRRLRRLNVERLHLGCGHVPLVGYLNVDFTPQADVRLDLRKKLPLPSDHFVEIFAEHVFEHLEFGTELMCLLRECIRTLRPGGVLLVSVPDAEMLTRAYAEDDRERFAALAETDLTSGLEAPRWAHTPMLLLSHLFVQNGNHRYGCDFETMRGAFERVGFVEVERRPFDPDRDHRPGSLLLKAVRSRAVSTSVPTCAS